MGGQTSIPALGGLALGNPGGLYDAKGDEIVFTGAWAEVSSKGQFGIMCAKGTNDWDAILPASLGANLLGVILWSAAYPADFGSFAQGLGSSGLDRYTQLSILIRGRCLVTVEQAVNQGDQAFCRFTAKGGNTQLGAFRKDSDLNGTFATAIQLGGKARFLTSQATIGGLAVLDVDMTNPVDAAG